MKILASSMSYIIRITDNIDDSVIASFLRDRRSYISAYNPFIEIVGPDSECDDVIYFLEQI